MSMPADRRYSETHEWAQLDGEVVRVGITSYAVEQLGDVIFLDLPAPATAVTQGVPFGEIESVKAVSDLYSPISGEVVEVNEELHDDYDLLADDPWGAWMIAIAPDDSSEMDALMDADSYESTLDEEA